ncbi:MAG: tetratricopeptide repeat protein [Bacillota bacterium]
MAQGKLDEAVRLAEDLVDKDPNNQDLKHLLAVALVKAADDRHIPRMADPDWNEACSVTLAYYYQAASNDPTLPRIYTGILRVVESAGRTPDYPMAPDQFGAAARVVDAWKRAVQGKPELAKDMAAAEAVAWLAASAGESVLAADLRPDWVDAQLAAGFELADKGQFPEAEKYYGRARKLAPTRSDVLVLAALLGEDVPRLETEVVLDVPLPEKTQPDRALVRGGKVFFSAVSSDKFWIYRLEPDGASPEPVVLATGLGRSFDVSADGTKLAYGVGQEWNSPWEVRVQDLRDGATKTVAKTTGPVRGLAWSPDGLRLAFASYSGLFVVNGDGSGQSLINEAKAVNDEMGSVPANPAWFKDGRRLVFGEVLYEGAGGIYVHDFRTGLTTELCGPETMNASLSPSGKQILYTMVSYGSSQESRALILNVQSKEVKSVTSGQAASFSGVWSPDGRYALITMGTTGSVDMVRVGREHYSLWAYDPQSGEARLVPGIPSGQTLSLWVQTWSDDNVIYAFAYRTAQGPGSDYAYRLLGLKIK